MIDVHLEIGKRRCFATAIEWPGWSRSGRGEAAALQALLDYGRRYAKVLRPANFDFSAPRTLAEFSVAERVPGNATTDAGAPAMAPAIDSSSLDDAQLGRLVTVLDSCWRAFDAGVKEAHGKELHKGPRGGGRDLEEIVRHVLEADWAYLGRIGWKFRRRARSGSGGKSAYHQLKNDLE